MALFNFGNIEGRQRGIEVKMEALRIAGLALRQAGKLLGISKNEQPPPKVGGIEGRTESPYTG